MKFTPYPYQIEAIKRTVNTDNIALMLDMGIGKTVITLSAISLLKFEYWAVRKVLVIAPKMVAEATWQQEVEKWDHLRNLRCSTVLGDDKRRRAAIAADADIYIINRENVTWLVDNYAHSWEWDMVVIDESSSFKSHTAKRFKSLKSVRGKINRIVELTGTPTPKGLEDLWAQIYLLDGGERLGKTITKYRNDFFRPGATNGYTVYNYVPRRGAQAEIQNLISDIAVSMLAGDYLQLPDLIYRDVPVKLNDAAQKQYDTMERDALLELGDDTVAALNAAAVSNKLLQLCNGAVYAESENEETVVAHVHDCKLDALEEQVELLAEAGENVIVCYWYAHDLTRITERLAKYKPRVYKSAADQTAWNNGKIKVLLMHPASCGYGLNLQAGGHHIIWFSLPWSLELYQQINKRLHRQGQEKPVTIHHLVVEHGRDEDVVKALKDKDVTQATLLSSLKARLENFGLST